MGKRFRQLQSEIQYGDFYRSWRKEIVALLAYYKSAGMHMAAWGAGLKGLCFLGCMDAKCQYIDYVIDSKANLHNVKTPTGHLITGIETIFERPVDAIFVMNSVYFVDIYLTLKRRGFQGQIIDVDKVIKNKLLLKDIESGNSEAGFESDDFYGYTMRQIQEKAFEILKEVDRVCRKHHIPYFLEAGSALGAARYEKIIPCDDDIDVAMLREDYDRFIDIAGKELKEGYLLQTLNKGSDYPYLYAQVIADHTCFVRETQKMLRMHHGIHIDIAPLDEVPAEIEERKKQKGLVEKYKLLVRKKKIPEVYEGKNPIKCLIVNWDYYLLRIVPLKYLEKKALGAFRRYQGKQTGWVGDLCTHYKKDISFPLQELFPLKQHLFEGELFPVPRNLDYYLGVMYDDYKMLSPREAGSTKYELAAVSLKENYVVVKDIQMK